MSLDATTIRLALTCGASSRSGQIECGSTGLELPDQVSSSARRLLREDGPA